MSDTTPESVEHVPAEHPPQVLPKETAAVLEPLRRFPDEDACRRHMQAVRWGEDRYRCGRCDETEHWGWLSSRNVFQCHRCGHQASITTGTIMQNTKLPLRAWFLAARILHDTDRQYRAADLARLLGIWPEAARNLMRKLRPALAKPETRRLLALEPGPRAERARDPGHPPAPGAQRS